MPSTTTTAKSTASKGTGRKRAAAPVKDATPVDGPTTATVATDAQKRAAANAERKAKAAAAKKAGKVTTRKATPAEMAGKAASKPAPSLAEKHADAGEKVAQEVKAASKRASSKPASKAPAVAPLSDGQQARMKATNAALKASSYNDELTPRHVRGWDAMANGSSMVAAMGLTQAAAKQWAEGTAPTGDTKKAALAWLKTAPKPFLVWARPACAYALQHDKALKAGKLA